MARDAHAPRNGALGAAQIRRASDVGHDAIAIPHYSTFAPPDIPQSLCPRCNYPGPHRVSHGTPPHHQRLSCGQCGRYLRWLPKPRPVAQEGRA